MVRFFLPSQVPRESHLRSRSRTLRTAWWQVRQQKRAKLRVDLTGCSWQPGRLHNGRQKIFCCVTTRWRNLWALSDLWCGLGPLAALFLYPRVLDFDFGVVAMLRLALRRLPAIDLSQAFRILAVPLVPTPRLVLTSARFVQAGPRAGAARSGLGTGLCLNVVVAHGRFDLPRESSGRMCHHSPRARSKREQNDCLPVYGCLKEQDRDQDGIRKAIRKRRSDRDTFVALVALPTRSQMALIFCAAPPNPFVGKCFGFPSSAWARHIYLLPERTFEPASGGAPGPAIGAADFTGQRVGDRPGAAAHVFSSSRNERG
jgi:hypothetical protein